MFQGWRGGLQNRLGGFDSQPSLPDAGSRPDNVRPSVEAYMEIKMVAENCTVGGNRLSVMVLRM